MEKIIVTEEEYEMFVSCKELRDAAWELRQRANRLEEEMYDYFYRKYKYKPGFTISKDRELKAHENNDRW